MTKVVVVGQGYVGLPLAMRAVEVGHEVVGIESDQSRASRLREGASYVEDVSSDSLQAALATGRYRPTHHLEECVGFDVALITVPTPLKDSAPDLSFIEAAGHALAPHVRPGVLVVLESTTYPGTTVELLAPILADGSGLRPGIDFHLGYSPERIDPGNDHWGLVNTPKVVSGIDPASLDAVDAFYSTLIDQTIRVSGTGEAELVKLLENTFRHVNIALVNEVAMFASDLGIDIGEALNAADTKPFGFLRFNPGPGVGGHCLPVDPSYLSWHVNRRIGIPFRFVELANDINEHMPAYVFRRVSVALERIGRTVAESRILLLGLAYKPNTGDCRESPAIALAKLLLDAGADVRAVDPHVEDRQIPPRVVTVRLDEKEIAAADIAILLTDHDNFDYELVAAHARHVFDTRRRMKGMGGSVEYL